MRISEITVFWTTITKQDKRNRKVSNCTRIDFEIQSTYLMTICVLFYSNKTNCNNLKDNWICLKFIFDWNIFIEEIWSNVQNRSLHEKRQPYPNRNLQWFALRAQAVRLTERQLHSRLLKRHSRRYTLKEIKSMWLYYSPIEFRVKNELKTFCRY